MLKQVNAVTLIEILVVVLIAGILISLALPNFGLMKESALNKEAKANLKLMQAAEKIYHIEYTVYWACNTGVAEDDIDCINTNLKLYIPKAATRNWDYSTNVSGDGSADRNVTGGRTWSLLMGSEDPSCTGTGCPP